MSAAKFLQIALSAHEAGMAALAAKTPTPMIVSEADWQGKPIGQQWFVEGGVCGFAWVKIKGNTGFGKWAKKQGLARSSYGGGLQISIHEGGQSLERKEAYAYAYAKVLNENGITAYSDSRMD